MESSALMRRVASSAALTMAIFGLVAWYFTRKVKRAFLNKQRKRVRIMDVKELSHDTKQIRLDLGGRNITLGLPVGKHLIVYAPNPPSCIENGQWNGKPDVDKQTREIQRKYTPVTGNEAAGFVDIVVKVYKPGTVKMPDGKEIQWADGGKCSLFLDNKKPGDYIEINGPVGVHEYLGRGTFKAPGRTTTVRHVGMMAGGAGLTPMLQIISVALQDPQDRTKFSLIYANKTEDDILCRNLLEDAVAQSRGRFTLHYTLDFPPSGWTHKKGFITQDMIKACLPPPAQDTMVLMCGPPPMVEFACKKNLEALGYAPESMITF